MRHTIPTITDQVNRFHSEALAAQIKPIPRQCYHNSFRALPLSPVGFRYTEGLAKPLSLPIPLEHGWLQHETSGQVIDVTWRDQPVSYVAIWSWSLDELHETLFDLIGNDGIESVSLPIGQRFGGNFTMSEYLAIFSMFS